MLLITCPVCGAEGDDADFTYGGQAHVKRPASTDPANVSDNAQRDYLYMRDNPRGPHHEMWRCTFGCGKWFNAVRDTVTMRFYATYRIGETPPKTPCEPAAPAARPAAKRQRARKAAK